MEITKVRLAICGPGKCGKDEAAKFLASITDLKYIGSTSYVALDFVWERYQRMLDRESSGLMELMVTKEKFFAARSQHRVFWAEMIDDYNRDDPARLYKDHVTNGSSFLVGIRRLRELRAAKKAGLFNLSIWIENPRAPQDASLDYSASDCDIVVYNNRSLNHLYYKLRRLADVLWIHKPLQFVSEYQQEPPQKPEPLIRITGQLYDPTYVPPSKQPDHVIPR